MESRGNSIQLPWQSLITIRLACWPIPVLFEPQTILLTNPCADWSSGKSVDQSQCCLNFGSASWPIPVLLEPNANPVGQSQCCLDLTQACWLVPVLFKPQVSRLANPTAVWSSGKSVDQSQCCLNLGSASWPIPVLLEPNANPVGQSQCCLNLKRACRPVPVQSEAYWPVLMLSERASSSYTFFPRQLHNLHTFTMEKDISLTQ